MEDVGAAEFLSNGDIAETNAALDLLSLLRMNILQLHQLKDELPPLVHRNHRSAQPGQVVNNFTEQVDWDCASRDHKQENSYVETKVTQIKDQVHAIKCEFLLEPLLLVVELSQRDLVLKTVLNCFAEEPRELEACDHIDVVHLVAKPEELENKDIRDKAVKSDEQAEEGEQPGMINQGFRFLANEALEALNREPVQHPHKQHRRNSDQLVDIEAVPEHNRHQQELENFLLRLIEQIPFLHRPDLTEKHVYEYLRAIRK